MNLFNRKLNKILGAFIIALFLTPLFSFAQNDTPCDCTQRWEGGAHWNSDGTIDDASNAPEELGVIRCGSSAETQSQVSPLSGCTYDSTSFEIDVASFPCVDPSTGNVVFPINPSQGEPIIWLNFDVRPNAGSFEIQINDGNENVAWALYHSDVITYGVSPNPNGLGVDSTSGSCSSLTLVACGVESSNSFSTLPVPNFSQAANYYIAIWDQDADGSVSLGNFKARYGCGDTDILLCNVSVTNPVPLCDTTGTYTLKIPVNGINGEFYAYDPNSNNVGGLSSSICLTNPGDNNPVTSDTLELTYNQGTAYSVIIFEATDTIPGITVPNGSCPDPLNPEGCRDTIAGPAPNCCVLIASTNSFNADCNGADNGSILAIGTGGAAPLTFAWSDGQSVAQAMNLAPGTYTVTITDANQCTATATGSVTEPTALNVQCVLTSNVDCNGGSNGLLSSIVTGGTLSYSYQWSSGSNLADAANLSAGTYTLVVTDGNGCVDSCTATITEPTPLMCTGSGTAVSCNGGNDGSATVSGSGGTSPYSYAWSNGQTGASASGLTAGTYTATVTDANQCVSTCTVTIGEPSALSCSTQGVNPLCNGGNDGSATVSGSGGTSPYTYAWSNGQTGASATGLVAGTYTATVTDANNCSATCTVILGEPTAIQITLTPSSSTCGFANGSVSSNVSGGTPNYTYAWSNGASTQNISNVAAGAYSLIVTDANGCKDTASTSVNDIGGPSVTADSTDVLCNGDSTGTATATASGGSVPYSYVWSDGQITQTATGLIAGTYAVTVFDANQCQASTTITVNEPGMLTVNCSVLSQISCFGGGDGSVVASASGGTAPYCYDWGITIANCSDSLENLGAGNYGVIVTDANGCTATCTVSLGQPAQLSCSTQGVNPLCNGGNDGSATVSGSGGTAPYTYAWSNGQTGPSASGLTAGTYTATVTDANQCVSTCTVTIGEPSALSCTTQGVNPLCNGGNDGSATVSGSGGTSPYTYAWSNGQTGANAGGLSAGTYTVTVTDANQCTSTCTVMLGEPSDIQITLTPLNSTCGFANGSVSATVSGGTGAYSYAWSNGATTQNLNGVTSAIYSLVLTDINGCKDSSSAFVGDIGGPSVTATGGNPLCNGDSTGTVNAIASGGTAGYSFIWSNGQATQTAVGLPAGTYTVTVFDANQCQASTAVTIVDPPVISCTVTGTNPLCFGGQDGTALVVATGGSDGGAFPFAGLTYYYNWSNGQTTAQASGLSAGTYTVTVSDDNQCTSTCSVTLGEPSEIILTKTDTFCFIQYGIGGYQHGAELTSVSAGDVTVTITADANQTMPDKVIVFNSNLTGTADPDLEVDLGNLMILPDNMTDANNDLLVDDPNDNRFGGTITLDFSDNVKVVSFKYVDQDDPNPSYARAYDAGGSLITSVQISNGGNGSVQAIVMNADNVAKLEFELAGSGGIADLELDCPTGIGQGATGSIDLTVSGGTPGYTYSWSNGASTQDINNVPAGIYTVTVTDDNGCSKTCSTVLSSPNLPLLSCCVSREIVCNGGNDGEIFVQAIGGQAPYSILWSTGATSNLITNCGAGAYSVTITDANGFSTFESMVLGEPELIDNAVNVPGGATICYGESATLEAIYDPTCSYQWYKYGNPIAGATNSSVTVTGKGNYRVVITNQTGCTRASQYISISKFALPTAAITSPGESFCPGEALPLTAYYENGYTYEWKRRGKVVSTANNTYQAVKPGKHKVVVTDANGCENVSNTIVVSKYPHPKIVLDELGPVDICQGSSITLNALPSNGKAPYSFIWYKYSNVMQGETNSSYTASNTGGYSVRIIDANGCTNKTPRTVVNKITCAPRTYTPKLSVSVYPNPFMDEINLTMLGDEEKPLHLAIYSVLGEVVFERDIADIYSMNKISLSDLESGMYLLEVRQGEEMQLVKINKIK